MKIKKIIFALTHVCVLGIAMFLIVNEFVARSTDSLKRDCEEYIKKIGNTNQINEEIKNIFREIDDILKVPIMLNSSKLKKYPAISSLGTFMGIFPAHLSLPKYIQIRYGTHYHTKILLLFYPESTIAFERSTEFIEITPNIYLKVKDYPNKLLIILLSLCILITMLLFLRNFLLPVQNKNPK